MNAKTVAPTYLSKRVLLCLCALLLPLAASPASATLISEIAALNPGDQYRVLFVSSTSIEATSPLIDVYNSHVQAAAAAGTVTSSLGFTWNALASTTSTNAQVNTGIVTMDTSPVTLFNTNGDIVALSAADFLDGALNASISRNENGAELLTAVWTGIFETAFTALPLGTPTIAFFGASGFTAGSWADTGTLSTSVELHLYGASSVGVAAAVVSPEPTSFTLAAMGLLVAGAIHRRRSR